MTPANGEKRNRPAKLVRRLGAPALAICSTALLLECTARAFLFGPAGLDPLRVDSVRPLYEEDILEPSTEPEIGYELRPDLDLWFKLVRLRTNSYGLRYREIAPQKPEGVFRVAVIGSSFTLPAGVALEDSYHAQLERRLSTRLGRPIEFVNFAVGAFSASQNYALLEKRALRFEPDLVLFGLTRMGAETSLFERTSPNIVPQARTHPFFESFLLKLIRSRQGIREKPFDPELAEPTELQASVIQRLGRLSRRTGIPVVIVRLEFEGQEASETDRRLRVQAKKHRLHYVDTRARFRGVDTRRLWIHELDPHPNPEAHAMFADVIADYLIASKLLPEPKDGASASPAGAGRTAR